MLSESPIAPASAVESAPSVAPASRMLFALFLVELIAINIARLPESLRFDRFAFCDHGANLTLQYLTVSGMRPALDFGYHYGLLPVLIGRIWFGVFGITPLAYQAAMVLADVLCVYALVQIIARLQMGGVARLLLFIALAYAYQASYVNFAHATEAALLSWGLAQQARGARSYALAFAAAAVFAKPSMGYVYGLLLLILTLRDLLRSGITWRRFIAAIAPAAAVFLILAAVVSMVFGLRTFLHTIVPLEGVTNYRALNFGLMKAGRGLWDPARRQWILFVVDVAGFWIVSGVFLFGAALFQLFGTSADALSSRRREMVIVCALLHLAFLSLFFGNQWSWIYYPYILIIGIAVASDLGRYQHRIVFALCIVAVVSYTDLAYWCNRWWRTTTPDVATAQLWAPPAEKREWLTVRALARDQRSVLLDDMGAAELMFPGFEKPVSLYLTGGLMQPSDVSRKVDQLSHAEIAIVPTTIEACSGVPDAPEFREALNSFDLAWEGKYFEVFRRRATR